MHCGFGLGGPVRPKRHPYEGIQHFAYRVWTTDLDLQNALRAHAWRPRASELSSLRWEYNTLHVDFDHRSRLTKRTADSFGEAPPARSVNPCRVDTTLCMSSLDHRARIPKRIAGSVWQGPHTRISLRRGYKTLHVEFGAPS